MDAPTSQGARRDPFPSTLRIQKEAILPNRFRADVRECFLIVSGYGDLSSERAYLRGETFSCVRDDGGVIEAKLDSYAVGEDGKAGVRGRVVSKQGQIIAKSLMAGFLGGVSEAFDVNPVPVVSTNPGSNTQYQSVFSDQMLQGAAVKGASKALDRIAQFYIDMAEGIFPVIEVDAGRQVDFLLVPDQAHAGTGGTAFDDVWVTLKDWTQGTLGRIVAGAMILVGVVGGIARQSLMAFAMGIGGGMGLYNSPTVVESIMSATLEHAEKVIPAVVQLSNGLGV
ncbi:hypothetical protein DA616_18230 [Salmonella enterica subsp. enterica serovar Dublin]|nr:hypothetical protein [Salmonella enterica subsp. enterica serovar Dublin]